MQIAQIVKVTTYFIFLLIISISFTIGEPIYHWKIPLTKFTEREDIKSLPIGKYFQNVFKLSNFMRPRNPKFSPNGDYVYFDSKHVFEYEIGCSQIYFVKNHESSLHKYAHRFSLGIGNAEYLSFLAPKGCHTTQNDNNAATFCGEESLVVFSSNENSMIDGTKSGSNKDGIQTCDCDYQNAKLKNCIESTQEINGKYWDDYQMDEIFDCLIISNQIYLADLTGKITAQLTSVNDGFNGLFPSASSDGKFIFYTSSASGSFELWRMNSSDGSDKIKLTDSSTLNGLKLRPRPSPDGKWLIFEFIPRLPAHEECFDLLLEKNLYNRSSSELYALSLLDSSTKPIKVDASLFQLIEPTFITEFTRNNSENCTNLTNCKNNNGLFKERILFSARNVTLTFANTDSTSGHGDTALFIANPDRSGLEQISDFRARNNYASFDQSQEQIVWVSRDKGVISHFFESQLFIAEWNFNKFSNEEKIKLAAQQQQQEKSKWPKLRKFVSNGKRTICKRKQTNDAISVPISSECFVRNVRLITVSSWQNKNANMNSNLFQIHPVFSVDRRTILFEEMDMGRKKSQIFRHYIPDNGENLQCRNEFGKMASMGAKTNNEFDQRSMPVSPANISASSVSVVSDSEYAFGEAFMVLSMGQRKEEFSTQQSQHQAYCSQQLQKHSGNWYKIKHLPHDFDIYKFNSYGQLLYPILKSDGFDGESNIFVNGSSTNALLAYTSVKNGRANLWLANFDWILPSVQAFRTEQLTNFSLYAGEATFSPDGKRIVFTGNGNLHTKNNNEQLQKILIKECDFLCVEHSEIFLINTDGTSLRQITHLNATSHSPIFLPDNEHILFSSNYKSNDQNPQSSSALFVTDVEGNWLEQLTFNENGFDGYAKVAKNYGQAGIYNILWSSNRGDKQKVQIYMADLNVLFL